MTDINLEDSFFFWWATAAITKQLLIKNIWVITTQQNLKWTRNSLITNKIEEIFPPLWWSEKYKHKIT